MGLEAGTSIDDLNSAWPIGTTDNVAEGDDHLRLIKTVLKTQFAGVAGDLWDIPVTTGPRALNSTELNKTDATAAPTVTDDSAAGYGIGSLWLDVTNDKAYIALDVGVGAAVWQAINPGATVGCCAGLLASQSQHATPGQWDQVLLDDVSGEGFFDTGGDFDIITNNEFVVPVGGAGTYAITAALQSTGLTNGKLAVSHIYIEGANTRGIKGMRVLSSAGTDENSICAGIRSLADGETIQLWGKTNNASGASWDGGAGSSRKTFMSIARVG